MLKYRTVDIGYGGALLGDFYQHLIPPEIIVPQDSQFPGFCLYMDKT